MTIVNPYRTCDVDIIKECGHSRIDNVERAGYVSPDKKIQTFIESGQLLQNYRTGGDEYELQGEETELDPDSPDYAEELTSDAEKLGEPLPQFLDKISAMETLDNAEKSLEKADKASNNDKSLKDAEKANSRLSDAIEGVLNEYDKLSKLNGQKSTE